MIEKLFVSDIIPKEDMEELMSEKEMGLESIRFSIGMNLDELDRQIELAREELNQYGNPPLVLHGPFLDLNPASYDSKVARATWDRFQQCYDAALELGARKIVYHTCRVPLVNFLDGWAERMTDFWNRFLEDKSGIGICMENVFEPEIEGIQMVAENVQHPDFSLCMDIGHIHCLSNRSLSEWVDALGKYVSHVHIHDNDKSKDQHSALGEGTIPLHQVLPTILKKSRKDLTWTIENKTLKDVRTSAMVWRKLTVRR